MILDRIETVIIKNGEKSVELKAKVDTGADRTSIDKSLVKDLGLEILEETKKVKSAHGNSTRAVVEAVIQFGEKKFKTLFTLADRSHMRYKVLLGQNQLKGFLIDPDKK